MLLYFFLVYCCCCTSNDNLSTFPSRGRLLVTCSGAPQPGCCEATGSEVNLPQCGKEPTRTEPAGEKVDRERVSVSETDEVVSACAELLPSACAVNGLSATSLGEGGKASLSVLGSTSGGAVTAGD